MSTFIATFANNFNVFITIIFSVIVLYIILFPHYLNFYFENTLGRFSLLLFIITMTVCKPVLGVITTVIFIGLYNYRANTVEGLENPSIPIPSASTKMPSTTTASTPGITPTDLNKLISSISLPLDKTAEPTTVPPPLPSLKNKSTSVATSNPVPNPVPNPVVNTEGFQNNLGFSVFNEGRNKMITIENYFRKPKSSNQMPCNKHKSVNEPLPNYPGISGLQSMFSPAK